MAANGCNGTNGVVSDDRLLFVRSWRHIKMSSGCYRGNDRSRYLYVYNSIWWQHVGIKNLTTPIAIVDGLLFLGFSIPLLEVFVKLNVHHNRPGNTKRCDPVGLQDALCKRVMLTLEEVI